MINSKKRSVIIVIFDGVLTKIVNRRNMSPTVKKSDAFFAFKSDAALLGDELLITENPQC